MLHGNVNGTPPEIMMGVYNLIHQALYNYKPICGYCPKCNRDLHFVKQLKDGKYIHFVKCSDCEFTETIKGNRDRRKGIG